MADFFSAVATFNLKIGKDSVKVTIVENETELEKCIVKVLKVVKSSPLVGFDLKTRTVRPNNTANRHILFLYVKNRCIVIVIDPSKRISKHLQHFFSSKVRFVGKDVSEKVKILLELCAPNASKKFVVNGATYESLSQSFPLDALAATVDVVLLAARTVKNPELKSSPCLIHVVKSIGLSLKIKEEEVTGGKDPDWTDLCLSERDMMIEMREAYLSYKIADFCRKRG